MEHYRPSACLRLTRPVYHRSMSRSTLSRYVALASLLLVALSCLGANAGAAESTHTNRLIDSNNPYLLLHAHNPVDWYPWGPEALEKAKRENKPIFLSIGYSTCYWCHVAERTLFSNPEIAKLMNQWFVSIKVDREERPDLDAVYMLATQLITSGPGGWPNNVFLTPDLKPFYAGGYFPPQDDELGRPGFPSVLTSIHDEWVNSPARIAQRADGVLHVLQQIEQSKAKSVQAVDPAKWLERTRDSILQRFDAEYGGLGKASRGTKFPQSPVLRLMLTDYERTHNPDTLHFLLVTLDAMAYGGLYDQLGGGFHRYSTERTWSIPHFEKMLYDNAQLLEVYARAWKSTGRPQYKRVALGVRDYLRRQMMSTQGGFYTAEDAAVDGVEGASYVWTRARIESVLGDSAAEFLHVYALTAMPDPDAVLEPETAPGVLRVGNATASGTVEQRLATLAAQRRALLQARDARPQPARDEKLLVGLNGLAIEAFALSSRTFRSRADLVDAQRAAERMWTLSWNSKTGRLAHQIFRGRAQGEGFLDDYALLGRGFLALYQAGGGKVWLQRATTLTDALLQRFELDAGAMSTVRDETLIVAPPEQGDEAYPSGLSASVDLLMQLSRATGRKRYSEAAERAARRAAGPPEQWPLLVAALNSVKPAAGDAGAASAKAAAAPGRPSATSDHVRVSGTVRSTPEHDDIVVTLDIEAGFHVNANPASFDFLVPTQVAFAGIQPLVVRYPPATALRSSFAPDVLKVYEGQVQAVAQLKKGSLDGLQALQVTVTAQACTDTVCLPPSRIPLTVRLEEIR
jgi:uncharacterized protein YyaL (SSP411 family)